MSMWLLALNQYLTVFEVKYNISGNKTPEMTLAIIIYLN